jgi:hypothetical protein
MYDDVRQEMPSSLPMAIRELIIAHIVVGTFTIRTALRLADAIAKRLSQ